MKGLILAGGHGTRLRPLTYSGNKHMLPIANKPILMYGLEAIRDAGVTDIGIILGPIKEGVRELLGDGKEYGMKITYIEQPQPLGLAHAVKVAQPFLGNEPFIMYLGDNLLKMSLEPLVSNFMANSEKASILLCPVKNPQQYGVAVLDDNKKVIHLIEKPQDPPSNLALVGVYLFKPEIHMIINSLKPSGRGEFEITDAIQGLINQKMAVTAKIVSGWWKDTGRPDDLLEANRLVLSGISRKIEGPLDPSVSIEGEVIIGKGSHVEANCRLRGPIIIGEDCHIDSNTYIGPCTSIGNEVKIGAGEIEFSILMDHVEIKCPCRIVDSIIGRNAKILSSEGNRPKGHKLIIGDQSYITL